MDTKRFELTEEEQSKVWSDYYYGGIVDIEKVDYDEYLVKAQVNKVLSLFEPVELEALDSDELMDIEEAVEDKVFSGEETPSKGYAISQDTVQKNQAKGQLYRIRSEKERNEETL